MLDATAPMPCPVLQAPLPGLEWRDGASIFTPLVSIVQAKGGAMWSGDILPRNLGDCVTQWVRVLPDERQQPIFIMPGNGVVDIAVAAH